VQAWFATLYNLWLLTVHRLLNIDSGTQAASTFVPYLYREFCIQVDIPICKGEGEETHRLVLKTRQTEDLKVCSQTPNLQVQHQFTIKHLYLSSSRAHTVSRRPDPTKKWITPFKRISSYWSTYRTAIPATAWEEWNLAISGHRLTQWSALSRRSKLSFRSIRCKLILQNLGDVV
jgi:hypothetical protein